MKLGQFGFLLRLLLVTGLGFIGYLFWTQNSSREVLLSLDLQFAAWQLTTPVGVSTLIMGSFLLGVVLTLMVGVPRKMAQSKRIRDLTRNRVFHSTDSDVSDSPADA
jgi:uncharacterized integral membrane protein